MAVVLALGVLVLQGCQTKNTISTWNENRKEMTVNNPSYKSNIDVCWRAKWEKKKDSLNTNVRSGQYHPNLDETGECSHVRRDMMPRNLYYEE